MEEAIYDIFLRASIHYATRAHHFGVQKASVLVLARDAADADGLLLVGNVQTCKLGVPFNDEECLEGISCVSKLQAGQ